MVAAGVVAAVVALAVVWRATGAGAWTDPERIHEMLRALGDSPWAIPAVWGVFVVATLVMVPINALFVAVGLTFGFVQALALSMSGALLATGVIDWIGRRFDVDPLLARAPDWVRRLKRRGLERAGVLQLTAMRLLPLGPFATVNLIWAASGVPRHRVFAATFVGLMPGVTATSALGEGLGLALNGFEPLDVALLVGGCLGLLALTWLGRRLLSRWLGGGALAADEEPG